MSKRIIAALISLTFIVSSLKPVMAQDFDINRLPAPGIMVNLSPAYVPVLIKGLQVHPENPLLFDFILDTGRSGLKINSPEFKAESEKLIKYFLASLTIKEDDLWVNLSPYEKDRIIPDNLGKTELGRDMLAQDYILKQLTASLIYPEKQLGKEFWDRVYTKAQEMYGTSQVPVNTFNKVWIVADKARVLERNNTGYVVGAHLKVMLEEDYMALQKHVPSKGGDSIRDSSASPQNDTHALASQIVKQIILPELEEEVNQGENFASLRQIFYSMILAAWYKLALKDALLNQVYSNKGKTGGVLSDDPAVKEKIYQQYLKAYKKGVFNYIKEDMDTISKQTVPRKYFSGGLEIGVKNVLNIETSRSERDHLGADGAMAVVQTNMSRSVSKAMTAGDMVEVDKSHKPSRRQVLKGIAAAVVTNILVTNSIPLFMGQNRGRIELLTGPFRPDKPSAIFIHGGNKSNGYSQVRGIKEGIQSGANVFMFTYDEARGDKMSDDLTETTKKLQNWLNKAHYDKGITWIPYSYGTQILREAVIKANPEDRKIFSGKLIQLAPIYGGTQKQDYFHNEFLRKEFGDFIWQFHRAETWAALDPKGPTQKWLLSEKNVAIFNSVFKSFDTLVPTHDDVTLADSKDPEIRRLYDAGLNKAHGQVIPFIGKHEGFTYVKGVINKIKEIMGINGDAAMTTKQAVQLDRAKLTEPGGIDLNARNMALDIAKDGRGVEMKFDPALVAEFQRGDFSGITPVIIQVTPITNALPILGLENSPSENNYASSP